MFLQRSKDDINHPLGFTNEFFFVSLDDIIVVGQTLQEKRDNPRKIF
jgi:hypothetical protein